MKFFKTLLPLMVTLLFTECGPSGNSFIIEGEFIGMKAGELYLFNPVDPTGKLDTLSIADYKFKYEGEVEDTIPYVLLFPNGVEHIIFVSPAKSIKYKAATNDLKNYQVTGSEETELMNQFRRFPCSSVFVRPLLFAEQTVQYQGNKRIVESIKKAAS